MMISLELPELDEGAGSDRGQLPLLAASASAGASVASSVGGPDLAFSQFRDQSRFWIQRVAVPLLMVIGVFGNLITVIIMTRRRMRSTTNMYLAALALVDMFYLVLTFLLGLSHYPNMAQPRYYLYWHLRPFLMMLTDACSNTSVWLTVTFTIERYIAVRYPMKGKVWCTEARARLLIGLVFVFGIVFAAPVPFEWKVIERRVHTPPDMSAADASMITGDIRNGTNGNDHDNHNNLPPIVTVHGQQQQQQQHWIEAKGGHNGNYASNSYVLALDYSDFGRNETYKTIYYWSTAVIFYFVPLFSLTLFNGYLIKSVHQSKRERNKMTIGQPTNPAKHKRCTTKPIAAINQEKQPKEAQLTTTTSVSLSAGSATTTVVMSASRGANPGGDGSSARDVLDGSIGQVGMAEHAGDKEAPASGGGQISAVLSLGQENGVKICSAPTIMSTPDGNHRSSFTCPNGKPPKSITNNSELAYCSDGGGSDNNNNIAYEKNTNSALQATSETNLGPRPKTGAGQLSMRLNLVKRAKQHPSPTAYSVGSALLPALSVPASSQERRITIMLIAVVILFLLCQIPSAAMLLYTSVRELEPNTNEHALVLAFGNIFNFLMAVNAAGNFILYSFLSKKYRKTFVILFCYCLRPISAASDAKQQQQQQVANRDCSRFAQSMRITNSVRHHLRRPSEKSNRRDTPV